MKSEHNGRELKFFLGLQIKQDNKGIFINKKIACMQQNKHKNDTETKAKNPKGNMHVRKEKPENHKLTSNVTKHTSKQHQTEPKLSWLYL